jgi:hypothetical protein
VYARHGRGELREFWSNDRNFRDEGLAVAREVYELLHARHREAGG